MSTYIDLSDRAIDALAKGPIKALVEAVSIDLRDEIVRTMDPGPPRTGREYPVPGTGIIDPATGRRKRGTGRTYRASAPGQPPAVRLGSYRDSWQTIPAVVDGDQVVGGAASDATTEDGEHFIGEILEYGTHDVVNYRVAIEPRPHIRPAMDEVARRWGAKVVPG